MNFIRDNIVKILALIIIAVVVVVVTISCQNREAIVIEGATKYTELENKLQSAAIKYVGKNTYLLPRTTEKNTKVTAETLIKNKYLKELRAVDNKNVVCNGYVEISKKYDNKKDYRYVPHLKCGNLYETKGLGEYVKTNTPVVTSGDGLYKNNETYYYRGEYPDNYVKIGERLYRIIEVTEDGYVKVISTDKTGYSYIWDNRYNSDKNDYYGINDFEKSRMKDNLIFLYNNKNEKDGEIYFTEEERNFMADHDFCIGKRSESDTAIFSEADCSKTESLKVGLINISDYYRASLSEKCKSTSNLDCNNYNYMFNLDRRFQSITYATTIASSDNSYSYYLISNGNLTTTRTNRAAYIYPVFYMDNSALYVSGKGSYTDPFIVR